MLLKVGPGPETERHPLSSLRNEPQVASREGRKAAAVSPKPPKWHALGGRRCSTSQLSALANPGPCIPGRLAAGSAVLPAAHRMEPLRSSCRLPHVRDAQNTKTWRDARRGLRFAPLNAHFANTALSRVLVEEAEKREVLYIYVKKEKGSYLKKKKKRNRQTRGRLSKFYSTGNRFDGANLTLSPGCSKLFPSPLPSLPPASDKTGTPVFLQVPLGDGRRGPAGQRQDKQVNASGGALYGPSLRPRVEAGPSLGGSWTKAATPTSLNWDCGERCRLHQGVVCAGAALEQLSSHSMTSGDYG